MRYREAHTLLEELADVTLDGTRKAYLADMATVPLLIIDDLGMRKLPHTAAEDGHEVELHWSRRPLSDRFFSGCRSRADSPGTR